MSSEEDNLLTLINTLRESVGVGPLSVSPALALSAQWMANDMANKNYFSHTDSLGRDPFTRFAAFGAPEGAGENIAAGLADAAGTFNQFKSDPPHYDIMVNPSFNVIGIARAYNPNSTDKYYWVNDFGTTTPSGGATTAPFPLVPRPIVPSVPSVPTVPSAPTVPSVPLVPSVPSVPLVPSVPTIPSAPTVPSGPYVPYVPPGTNVPTNIPTLYPPSTYPSSTYPPPNMSGAIRLGDNQPYNILTYPFINPTYNPLPTPVVNVPAGANASVVNTSGVRSLAQNSTSNAIWIIVIIAVILLLLWLLFIRKR